MYPTADLRLSPALPPEAEFWTPDRAEIELYDGFGNFDNVWAILDVEVRQASDVVAYDGEVSGVVGSLANSELDFEDLACAAESGSTWDLDYAAPEQLLALTEYLPRFESLEGLEIGIAGLTYAIAAAGMYPAASCRGHASGGWSSTPVLFLASDRRHAEVLQPFVEEAGCGFAIDPIRPELLVITGRSIRETVELGRIIVRGIRSFNRLSG